MATRNGELVRALVDAQAERVRAPGDTEAAPDFGRALAVDLDSVVRSGRTLAEALATWRIVRRARVDDPTSSTPGQLVRERVRMGMAREIARPDLADVAEHEQVARLNTHEAAALQYDDTPGRLRDLT